MYRRETIARMQVKLQEIIPVFHKTQHRNLTMMVIGIVMAKSVQLPKIAPEVATDHISNEAYVQRFERLVACEKFEVMKVMKAIATRILKYVARWQEPIVIVMDRSMINDTLNLLHVAVAFGKRALPLGWVEVPHEGSSDLELQKKLLGWVKECLPRGVEVVVVADREFHSIYLAKWIETEMGAEYVLRIKAKTWVEVNGEWQRAGSLAVKGESHWYQNVLVTKHKGLTYRVNFVAYWDQTEDEPWLLITACGCAEQTRRWYEQRFWIEEMFSDQKSRALNLESSRMTDSNRLQRLLVAVCLAYLWIMELGAIVVRGGYLYLVNSRGSKRTISLCLVGLKWVHRLATQGTQPQLLSCCFDPVEES